MKYSPQIFFKKRIFVTWAFQLTCNSICRPVLHPSNACACLLRAGFLASFPNSSCYCLEMLALMLNTVWSRAWKEARNNVNQLQQTPFSLRFQKWLLGKHIRKFTVLWGFSKTFLVLVYACVYINLGHHINAACIHCMFLLSYVQIILCGLYPQTWSWWLRGTCYCRLSLTCHAWFYVFTPLPAKTAASYFIR